MQVFRFSAHYICLVLWMLTKKHISALVYVAITVIMLFGVQQSEQSCSVQVVSRSQTAFSSFTFGLAVQGDYITLTYQRAFSVL